MILHKRMGFVPVYYETPGVTSGGQGGAPIGTIQPPAGGQGGNGGDPTAQQGDFNWGLFPDVPEEQRPLLQPHLRGVLGHVTRVEEQFSPFRPLMQAGITQPEVVNGLLNFAQSFDQDPVSTWVELGQNLQQSGAISDDIDFEQVQAIIDGTAVDDEVPQGTVEGLPEGVDPNSPMGQLLIQQMAQIQELTGRLEELSEGIQQERTQQQTVREERLLREITRGMRASLTEAGFSDEMVTDQLLNSALIAHRGDHEAALHTLTGIRDGSVRRALQDARTGPRPLDLPRGSPPTGVRPRPTESFAKARMGAQQFLNQARAQEQET
jgi:hypothetical protein